MANKKRILVLTDTMPWGHRSIAKAIFGFLKSKEKELDIQVDYAEVKAETGIGGDAYTFAYRYLPASNRIAHRLGGNEAVRKFVREVSELNLPGLRKAVGKYKPDLIFCSYFYHSHSLARWREDVGLKFKLWTVVADPWTVNPISFVEGADLHLVYDEHAEHEAIKYGIPREKILQTGWWVRPEMYQKFDKKSVKRKLGISDGQVVVFVGGGSLGTNSLTKILPVLLMVEQSVTVIFNTGTDKLAYNLVEEYIKLFKRLRKGDRVKIINMGWIENMAEILSICDIVFGKAGPNFLFDVVATKKPLVAITHIGGQEDGNIELIKKKKLGWVMEKGNQAAEFLLEYLKNPEYYDKKYIKEIRAEAERNQESWGIIEKKIKEELR